MTQYQCPCCGYYTLKGRGIFNICKVCFWEDHWADDKFGRRAAMDHPGPNHGIHLHQARVNFLQIGAMSKRLKKHCRSPLPEEMPVVKYPLLTRNQRKAIERRQAALAKRAATPKSEPRPEPIRLGEHVTLQHRVIAGPSFTEQLRALGKRAKKGTKKNA